MKFILQTFVAPRRRPGFAVLLALAGWLTLARAAVPPAEQILPADTLVLATIPDFQKAWTAFQNGSYGQLWNDPEMKPFREKVVAHFNEEFIAPLEKELSIKVSDYTVLAQGQITLAVVQNGWEGREDQSPAWVLLLDSRDKEEQLKKQLAEVRQKWTDSGKKMRTDKIRDIDFTTLIMESGELSISLPNGVKKPKAKKEDEDDKEEKPKPKKLEVTVGQSGPLLLVGNAIPVIEKILGKLGGGTVPVLADLPAFEANQRVIFRDATGFAWANARPFVDILTKQLAAQTPPGKQPAGMTPSPSKITAAAGISGLQTLAVAFKQGDDGAFGQFFLGVPEASRRGLFKLLIPEAKDSAPPAFVSGDVTKFTRYRLDGQKTWATLEAMLAEISPQISALVQTSLNMIGKEKDPNYNFKKRLIGNLGDDVVLVQRPPRGEGLEALQNAPGLTLLGSPDAEQLAQAIKAAAALSPTGGDGLKEREFLGKKIYSLPLPPSPESKFAERYFNFAASGGYVAMSGDAATLEEYLRNHEDAAKPLRATPGLDDAAQRVGGMNTGWFGYENQSESLRRMLELAKNSPELFDKLVQKPGAKNPDDEDDDDEDKAPAKPWLDYKLLPPFEKISKYFNYSIYAGVASADGFSIKWFAPVPPQLKK